MKVVSHDGVQVNVDSKPTTLFWTNETISSATMIRKIFIALSVLFLILVSLSLYQKFKPSYNNYYYETTTTANVYNSRTQRYEHSFTIPELDERAGNATDAEEYLIFDNILNPDDFNFIDEDSDLQRALQRYHVHVHALSWKDAAISCWHEGGRLATPGDATEARLLGRLLQYVATNANITGTNNTDIMHIGVANLDSALSWANVEGRDLKYMNWLNSKMKCHSFGYFCAGILTNGRFVEVACDEMAVYTCDLEPVEQDIPVADDGYETLENSTHLEYRYKFHSTPLSWLNAQEQCEKEGGILAMPSSYDQSASFTRWLFSKSVLPAEVPSGGVLVAFNDILTENTWMTSDGLYMDYLLRKKLLHSDGGRAENCLAMLPSGMYDDVACAVARPFVCQKENVFSNVERGTYAAVQGLGRYAVHHNPKTWWQALLACRAENATLAVPDTEEEAAALTAMERDPVHVGVHDSDGDWIWRTVDGRRIYGLQFNKWSHRLYDDRYKTEPCATLENGLYKARFCNFLSKFVCEKPLGRDTK